MPAGALLGPLLAQAAALISEGNRRESKAGSLSAARRPLLREMNSYYTNKTEMALDVLDPYAGCRRTWGPNVRARAAFIAPVGLRTGARNELVTDFR
jgi:hypothetical protein